MALEWTLVNPKQYADEQRAERDLRRSSLVKTGGAGVYTDAIVSSYTFTLKTMLSLGFGSMAQFEGRADVSFFVIDIAAYTDTVLVQDVNDVQIKLERLGFGFRVGIASWGVDFRAAANVGAVAASVQIKNSSVYIDVELAGAPLKQLPFIQSLLARTEFNPEYLEEVSAAAAGLTDFMAEKGEQVTPVTLKIAPLDQPVSRPLVGAYSSHLALEQIYRWRTALEAMTYAQQDPLRVKNTDITILRSTYRVMGLENDYQRPNAEQVDEAYRLLNLGR
jgi:hypothetical protein